VSQRACGRVSWPRSSSAQSAGVEVIATISDAMTAKMNASASGPTNRPCTLEVKSSGRNTAITTVVA
jgi:ribosome maturation factor RimP